MYLFLLASLALANNTGPVRYDVGTSHSLPIPAGVVGGVDGVGTALSGRVLGAVQAASQSTGYRVRLGATCESGSVGMLTLASLDTHGGVTNQGTTVDETRLNVSGQTSSYGQTFQRSATRNGTALAWGQSQDARALDVGFEKRVPASESVGTVSATARWVLKGCDGAVVYDDVESVTLERRQLTRIDGQDVGEPVDLDALTATGVPPALADVHVEHFDVRSVKVERRFYDGGTAGLEAAAKFVRGPHQDWDAAKETWLDASYSSDPKIQAWGLYDLALYYERAGDVEKALKVTDASLRAHPTRLARTLREELAARVARARATQGAVRAP